MSDQGIKFHLTVLTRQEEAFLEHWALFDLIYEANSSLLEELGMDLDDLAVVFTGTSNIKAFDCNGTAAVFEIEVEYGFYVPDDKKIFAKIRSEIRGSQPLSMLQT